MGKRTRHVEADERVAGYTQEKTESRRGCNAIFVVNLGLIIGLSGVRDRIIFAVFIVPKASKRRRRARHLWNNCSI